MKTKRLGSKGLMVSEIGLGCMGMSDFYGAHDDEESLKTLHRAAELGVTFWDTSDMYGPYLNEELLAKALKGRRDQITLATKFGIVRDPLNPSIRRMDGKPEYVFKACDTSLKRLNTNTIDLYYLHRVDPATPIEETVEAMAELIKQGKVRTIGLSEVSPNTLRRAHAVHPISVVQSEYSLWTRDPEDGVLDVCKELGIGFVAYSPLGRGFLTGQIKSPNDLEPSDARRMFPRFQSDNFSKNLDLVKYVEILAREKNVSPAQLVLAWVLAQGNFIVPIPGTRRIKYLEENIGAANVSFTPGELKELDNAAPKGSSKGLRYPEPGMKSVNQ